ncbi:hypothetical protein SISNIDRAFT_444049 [Sistotremastrum niveocremeum HHB9708]|uniref:protein kinase C n=1 Tax=Sistotremastrum niveocremeum HHB9708 TaxID=1314777 RepID=A0A164RGM4_9AGAM|nr:hypothetical protein SISNIDRAFT_444049 [Sistotremastrum niveocremeum HHB9708]
MSQSGESLDQKISDVRKRIQTERKMLDASRAMKLATKNPDVLRRTDTQIREAERSLSYFEHTLRDLQAKKQAQQTNYARSATSSVSGYSASSSKGWSSDRDRSLPPPPSSAYDSPRTSLASSLPDVSPEMPKPKQYSNLDLIKADTPYTPAKISRMLHQLEYKLQVEMQYKKGINQMANLYQLEGDKKSRQEAESKRVENDKKIQLLQTALKRYKNLHVLDVDEEEEDLPLEGERKDNLRKPLTGKLYVNVKAAKDLDHAPLTKRAKSGQDTTVVLKVEGTPRARSHPSRTDRWNEDFEIAVDKANEVEITLYDKQANDHPIPIGLLWLRISDLVEALRRQKVGAMDNGVGWVTAEGAMEGNGDSSPAYSPPSGYGGMDAPLQFPGSSSQLPGVAPLGQLGQSEGIDAWFAVEPAGAIALHLNFVKENVRKRPLDAGGLGRQGAVRKRKGEVHEMNGHKFVQKQFFQPILCAFCSEFLLNAFGYQCEDCIYTCHKKCYEKVLTKCISKSNTEVEGDEEKINHRIPHRFAPITNIGANWCCHCGYFLPLGRKNARKCTECNITCHESCAHLVPDFCGMPMDIANELLRQWKEINKGKQLTQRASQLPAQRPPPSTTYTTEPSRFEEIDELPERTGRLDLIGAEPDRGSRPPPGHRPQDVGPTYRTPQHRTSTPEMRPPSQPTAPYGPPSGGRPPSSGRISVPPAPEAQLPSQTGYGSYDSARVHPPPSVSHPPHIKPHPFVGGLPSGPQQGLPSRPGSGPALAQHPIPSRTGTIPVPRKRKVGLDDFNFLAVLGKGNFGKVMLAEEKTTTQLYAIKVLKKEFIIDNDEVESTRSEKRVFLAAARERHPFLLDLHSCFQTETRVYFVMEYVSGGDLMLHIQRKQFSLRQAKFYASEVLLALEYFHANGIIYRDLKLDNILLTLEGHVKVADYGLCKEEMWYGETTSTFCGTPEFMAPEILLEQRYGRAVDWWAFGVLTYEMLLGQSPFRGDDEDEIFDAILEDEPLYPITMPRDAVSILQKLLTRDPARRLGSGKSDAEEIKRHAFFKDVNFDDVFHKRIQPPYCPTINGTADTSNFDEEFTREQPTLTPVHGQLSARAQAEFQGFSWVSFPDAYLGRDILTILS